MLQTCKSIDTYHLHLILSLISRFPCFYEWRGTHKMKSDTGNKMSDQLRLKTNRRAVLLVFTAAQRHCPITAKSRAASYRIVNLWVC